MKIIKVVIAILIALVFVVGVFFVGTGYGVYYAIAPMGGEQPVSVDIPEGASVQDIAESLEEAHAIRSAMVFRAVVKFNKSPGEFQPGKYTIDPNKTILEIIQQLKTGQGSLRLITVPEGLVIKEIALLMEKNKVIKAADFHSSIRKYSFSIEGKKIENLEGYLLPDTYDIPPEYSSDDVIKILLDAFNEKVVPLYNEKKNNLPIKLSLHQVVTLASLVEREAQVPGERTRIARVYYNRLQKKMPLQCDATVQYVLGKQKEVLTYQDLKIESPYNTYLHKGLPPGPIANPGIESIKAVLDPEDHEYLFYVRNDVKNDGSHVFSKTYAEHNQAIKTYQK